MIIQPEGVGGHWARHGRCPCGPSDSCAKSELAAPASLSGDAVSSRKKGMNVQAPTSASTRRSRAEGWKLPDDGAKPIQELSDLQWSGETTQAKGWRQQGAEGLRDHARADEPIRSTIWVPT